MDEEDAAAAATRRQGGVDLRRRLGVAVLPQRRLQAGAAGAHAQVDGRIRGDRDRRPLHHDAPVFTPVGRDDKAAVLGCDADELEGAGAP